MHEVKFVYCTQSYYSKYSGWNKDTLYFCTDTRNIYKGNEKFVNGKILSGYDSSDHELSYYFYNTPITASFLEQYICIQFEPEIKEYIENRRSDQSLNPIWINL